MFRNILVTLDGSTHSEAVLPVVADLAAGGTASVTLFAVSEPPSAIGESRVEPPAVVGRMTIYPRVPHHGETRTQAIERRENELREQLDEKAKPLRDRGIEVQVAVALGDDAAEAIIGYARAHPVDLIAMATHGRTGLRSVIFGSVAGKVVGSGVRPVLLVRPRELGHHTH